VRGVPVGGVSAINVSYRKETGTVVQVLCEIDQSPFAIDAEGDQLEMRDAATVRRMVSEGLQARLNLIGITGMLYVEMDFYDESVNNTFVLDHSDYVAVPSAPSALA